VRVKQPAVRVKQPAVRVKQPAVRVKQPAVRVKQPAVRVEHSQRKANCSDNKVMLYAGNAAKIGPRCTPDKRMYGIFGSKGKEVTGGWRKLHSEELHNMNCHLISIY
jgi:hypothetical protein